MSTTVRTRLARLLAGTKEVVPYQDGEKVWLYCGKACRKVEHTVIARYAGKPYALCGHAGCTRSAPDLPRRYRVTRHELEFEAARSLPGLLDAIARVEAQCDEWDRLSKGETPTTARIRARGHQQEADMSKDIGSELCSAQVALETASLALDGAQRQLERAEQRVQTALGVVRDLHESIRDGRVLRGVETLGQVSPLRVPPPPPLRPAPLPDPVVPDWTPSPRWREFVAWLRGGVS